MSNGTEQRKLAAIMFTDMVGYSALAQRNEALALELLEEHRSLLRGRFPKHQGTEIKTTGDGFLVEFASALAAVRCAIEIQRSLATRNVASAADRQLQVRIGIHVGDVVHHEGDVLGDGVNIASRIEPLAGPGGICISVDVERQIRNAIETSLVKLGPMELKNIQAPMELFRIVLPWEKAGPLSVERGASGRGRNRLLFFGSIALLVFGTGYFFWPREKSKKVETSDISQQAKASPGQTNALDPRRVVVLPLDNLSPDANDEYFARGLTEDLTSCLAKITNLTVIGRTSSEKVKKDGKSVAEIGRELQVGTVLEGSVRKAGNQLRITVQLIDVATEGHLLSADYDREFKDVFAVQSEVAQRVAEVLTIKLLAGVKQQIEKKGTENLEAYNSYLRGRFFWNKRTAEDFKTAMEYFNQAIELDPKFSLPYAGLASTYSMMPLYAKLPSKIFIPKARAAAIKALQIDSTLAEAHAALAFIKFTFEWDWAGAGEEFRRTIEQSPNDATAHHWYCIYLRRQGRFDEAMKEIKHAQELDPLSLVINVVVGDVYYLKGDYDKAIAQHRKTLELDPNFAMAHLRLGEAYVEKGMFNEAISEFQIVRTLLGKGPVGLSGLGHAYALSGRGMEALKVLDELNELAKQGYSLELDRAEVYNALGEKDKALDWLEKAVEEHARDVFNLKVSPIWTSLRREPRFIALLKKIGLDK